MISHISTQLPTTAHLRTNMNDPEAIKPFWICKVDFFRRLNRIINLIRLQHTDIPCRFGLPCAYCNYHAHAIILWLSRRPCSRSIDAVQQDSTLYKLGDECHASEMMMSNKLLPGCLQPNPLRGKYWVPFAKFHSICTTSQCLNWQLLEELGMGVAKAISPISISVFQNYKT